MEIFVRAFFGRGLYVDSVEEIESPDGVSLPAPEDIGKQVFGKEVYTVIKDRIDIVHATGRKFSRPEAYNDSTNLTIEYMSIAAI